MAHNATHRVMWADMSLSLTAIHFYLPCSALALNPHAHSVWGYLRTSLACAGRTDLVEAVDREDLKSLQQALPL